MKIIKEIPENVDIDSKGQPSRCGCLVVAGAVIAFWAFVIYLAL